MAAKGYTNRLVTFDADLDAFATRIGQELGRVVRRVAIDVHDKIVRRTPVDTGRARASWTMSIDTPAPADAGPQQLQGLVKAPAGPGASDPAIARSQESALQALAALKQDPYRKVWITNNVVYIIALEHGHSKQAPLGMVAISVAEAEAEIARLLGGVP